MPNQHTEKPKKQKVLAARVPDALYERVNHLAWLTRRSMNDVLLSIIEPTIDLTYELMEAKFDSLSATERVEADSMIDIEALKKHSKFMEAMKRQGRPAIPFPHVKRDPKPDIPERSNRGNQNTKNTRHTKRQKETQSLADDIRAGKVDKKTHLPVEPDGCELAINWMKSGSEAND